MPSTVEDGEEVVEKEDGEEVVEKVDGEVVVEKKDGKQRRKIGRAHV